MTSESAQHRSTAIAADPPRGFTARSRIRPLGYVPERPLDSRRVGAADPAAIADVGADRGARGRPAARGSGATLPNGPGPTVRGHAVDGYGVDSGGIDSGGDR